MHRVVLVLGCEIRLAHVVDLQDRRDGREDDPDREENGHRHLHPKEWGLDGQSLNLRMVATRNAVARMRVLFGAPRRMPRVRLLGPYRRVLESTHR